MTGNFSVIPAKAGIYLFLSFSFLCPSLSHADITDSLAGFWKLDEGSGGTSYDYSGNSVTATLVNSPSWTTGKKGQAVSLNGTSQYFHMSTNYDYTSQPFTIAYWINLNSLSTNEPGQGPVPVFKGRYQNEGYYSQISSDGSVSFATNQSGAVQSSSTSAGAVTTGSWYHIAYARNGTSVRIYVNGVDSTTTAASHTNPVGSSYDFQVGNYNAGFIFTNGILDDVRVYSRVLTASEINSIYLAGTPQFISGGTSQLNGFTSN